MSIIYSDRHQRLIDTDFESEEDYDTQEDILFKKGEEEDEKE